MDVIRPARLNGEPRGEAGYVGVCSDLVNCDKRYSAVIASLLGRTAVAETLTDAIAISMDDRPGGFADVMETVAEAKISVEYMYAFLTPADDDRACIIMCTSDGERAVRLLREKGITILSGDEIYTL